MQAPVQEWGTDQYLNDFGFEDEKNFNSNWNPTGAATLSSDCGALGTQGGSVSDSFSSWADGTVVVAASNGSSTISQTIKNLIPDRSYTASIWYLVPDGKRRDVTLTAAGVSATHDRSEIVNNIANSKYFNSNFQRLDRKSVV